MRPIKFRVWNKRTKKWVHGPKEEVNLFGEVILLGGFMDGVNLTGLNHCVALQYTGRKDKNNTEIYEGDILKCLNRNFSQYVEVKFHPLYSAFLFEGRLSSDFFSLHDPEVAGNIFENSELLSK
jgi:hypothetical protein